MNSRTSAETVARYLRTLYSHARYPALAALRDTPTLVIVGDKDMITPLTHSEEIVRRLPDAEFVTVPDSGHVVMLEHARPGQRGALTSSSKRSARDRRDRGPRWRCPPWRTPARSAAASPACCAPGTWWCSPARWAPARPPWCRASAPACAVRRRHHLADLRDRPGAPAGSRHGAAGCRWCTPTRTGWATRPTPGPRSTTSTWTPRWRSRSPWWSGARAWSSGWPTPTCGWASTGATTTRRVVRAGAGPAMTGCGRDCARPVVPRATCTGDTAGTTR